MTVYEIPLASVPQTFQIALGTVNYTFNVYWNWVAGCWFFDLSDADTSTLLLAGAPLVTGADLLAQYGYLGIGGELIVQTDNDPLAQPTFFNLGDTAHLYFIPTS